MALPLSVIDPELRLSVPNFPVPDTSRLPPLSFPVVITVRSTNDTEPAVVVICDPDKLRDPITALVAPLTAPAPFTRNEEPTCRDPALTAPLVVSVLSDRLIDFPLAVI